MIVNSPTGVNAQKVPPHDAEMKLIHRELARNQVNRAGRLLVEGKGDDVFTRDGLTAIDLVNSWRAEHSYPLRAVSTVLRRHARAKDSTALISQRLKRMRSIISKLERQPRIQVTNMQDIGGCRAVLQSLRHVKELAAECRAIGAPTLPDDRKNMWDYIHEPKPDGYRSIHFVLRYHPRNPDLASLVGRRIELQIRTRLQHAWATAVETVDLFGKQNLKIGRGHPKWARLFALVGTVFAIKEHCPCVPGTPDNVEDLLDELRTLWAQCKASTLFSTWMRGMKILSSTFPHRSDRVYLLEANTERKQIGITSWPGSEIDQANAQYASLEKDIEADPSRSAVLVAAESIKELEEAYPSFYADTERFVGELAAVLDVPE